MHVKIAADVVGGEMERVRAEGGGYFTPANLVTAAEPLDAPLHPAFEWNNDKAAKKWREEQASHLVRNIVVVSESKPDSAPIRAFVSVVADDEPSRYTSISRAMAHPALREQILAVALRDMEAFERKYSQFSEFALVVSEMKKVRSTVKKQVENRAAA